MSVLQKDSACVTRDDCGGVHVGHLRGCGGACKSHDVHVEGCMCVTCCDSGGHMCRDYISSSEVTISTKDGKRPWLLGEGSYGKVQYPSPDVKCRDAKLYTESVSHP
jgi:hypothetical protein